MPDTPSQAASTLRGRVLVVDDEYDMRFLTRASLEVAFPAVQIREAPGGKEALALLESTKFDVVVSDHRMPLMDGFTLLSRIAESMPASRLILMTAYMDKGLQQRAAAAGMAFIEKGGDHHNVVVAVERVLRGESAVALA